MRQKGHSFLSHVTRDSSGIAPTFVSAAQKKRGGEDTLAAPPIQPIGRES